MSHTDPSPLQPAPNESTAINLLYDGLCPVCTREIRWLKWLDRHHRLATEDITRPEFDPAKYGLTHEQVIGAMYGILPDGTVVTGVATFRHAYSVVGLRWLLAWTNWPIFRTIADAGYRLFARIRPRLSKYAGPNCEGDRCSPASRSQSSQTV